MSRSTFGNTWWGEQWLNALARIDHNNRLPRGRTYANNGSVRELKIDGSIIHAKVKGSRPRPYEVSISLPAVDTPGLGRFLAAMAGDPLTIARLYNGEIDPALLDIARHAQIGLFPTRWNDLSMRCSCPDSAVPCKHLAAVVYLVSREIDSDPLLVFRLRGIDLKTALRTLSGLIGHEGKPGLPGLKELLPETTANAKPAPDTPNIQEAPDFSHLPDLALNLWNLLPENPPFFTQGDFREISRRTLTPACKAARKLLDTIAEETVSPFDPADIPHLVSKGRYEFAVEGLKTPLALPDFIIGLERLNPEYLPDLHPAFAWLASLHQSALHLLANGAVMPQVFQIETDTAGLRWLPALPDAQVQSLMDGLESRRPPGLLWQSKTTRKAELAAAGQTLLLCSLILDHYIRLWSNPEREKSWGDKTLTLFFVTGSVRFNAPGEGSIALGIHQWLSRLSLPQQDYAPVILLRDGHDDEANRFLLELAVENRQSPLEPPVPLARLLQDPGQAAIRFHILQSIARLTEFHPALADYVRQGANTPLSIATGELPDLLFHTLPLLRLLGIRILMPKALERLLRPRLSMKLKGTADAAPGSDSFLHLDDLLDFNWQIAVGDHLINEQEFLALLNTTGNMVRFKGEYVYLDPEEMAKLRTRLQEAPEIAATELLRIALAGDYLGAPVSLDHGALALIKSLTEAGDVPLPSGLTATLRPYQQRGFAWLYRNLRAGFGSIIADDMGLGKTLQVITTLLKLKEEGLLAESRALVIVPTSLLTNWEKEIQRFAPGLSAAVFHGSKRELADDLPDVLLTTYGVVRTTSALKSRSWQVVVIDEAQNIKNPATAQTKAVKAIPARSRIAMSGTPVENRLSEYWSLMDFANHGYLGSVRQFVKEYAVPIQTHHDAAVAQRFRQVTAPFLLRRLKSDKSIITDLPDKIEQDQFCGLTPAQAALYESVVREAMAVIQETSETFKRQGLVLQLIMALKQVCNHPAQYLKEGERASELSGKGERFLELLADIYSRHEKVLVFTQYREMGGILEEWVEARFGRRPLFLHGGVSRDKRDEMVERFQHDRAERVFILSLKAGGTGLNLTAASNVIHYDLWWNPAVEAQATDRAYRIGQENRVMVHRLITQGTFEERINDMINAKRNLADMTVGAGEQWIGQLGDGELRELFRLG